MSGRYDERAIERSQGERVGPVLPTSDSLRDHLERERGRMPLPSIRVVRYVIDVRHASGRVVQSYNADSEQLVAQARQHAKEIEGYTTAHEVLDDFR